MNLALKNLFYSMINKRCFGGKHTPEKKIIVSKTRWLSREEARQFDNEYHLAVRDGLIIRMKKRTKKGSDWHISLNPRKIREIYNMIEGE